MSEVDDTLRRGDVFHESADPHVFYLVTRDPTPEEHRQGIVWFYAIGDVEQRRLFYDVELVYCPAGDFEKGHKVWLLSEIYEGNPVPEDLETIDRKFQEEYERIRKM